MVSYACGCLHTVVFRLYSCCRIHAVVRLRCIDAVFMLLRVCCIHAVVLMLSCQCCFMLVVVFMLLY